MTAQCATTDATNILEWLHAQPMRALGAITDTSIWSRSRGTNSLGSQSCLTSLMLKALFSMVFAAVMWIQVPQWQPDWSQCSVDTPDVDCHWYVTAPDNTFGEGFSWENAPWFSAEGLRDVGELNHTMMAIHSQAAGER